MFAQGRATARSRLALRAAGDPRPRRLYSRSSTAPALRLPARRSMMAGARDHRWNPRARPQTRGPLACSDDFRRLMRRVLVVLANEVALVLDDASPLASPGAISEEHSAVVGDVLAHRLGFLSLVRARSSKNRARNRGGHPPTYGLGYLFRTAQGPGAVGSGSPRVTLLRDHGGTSNTPPGLHRKRVANGNVGTHGFGIASTLRPRSSSSESEAASSLAWGVDGRSIPRVRAAAMGRRHLA
jgi:hypothetical protein